MAASDIEEAAFGGKQPVTHYDHWGKAASTIMQDKQYNVYMLFYRLVPNAAAATLAPAAAASAAAAPVAPPAPPKPADGPCSAIPAVHVKVPDQVLQRIRNENASLLRQKQVQDTDYYQFLLDLASCLPALNLPAVTGM